MPHHCSISVPPEYIRGTLMWERLIIKTYFYTPWIYKGNIDVRKVNYKNLLR